MIAQDGRLSRPRCRQRFRTSAEHWTFLMVPMILLQITVDRLRLMVPRFLKQDPERAESYCLGRITLCYEATPDDEAELNLALHEDEGGALAPASLHVCCAAPLLATPAEASE